MDQGLRASRVRALDDSCYFAVYTIFSLPQSEGILNKKSKNRNKCSVCEKKKKGTSPRPF